MDMLEADILATPCDCGDGVVVLLSDGTACCSNTLDLYRAMNGKPYPGATNTKDPAHEQA